MISAKCCFQKTSREIYVLWTWIPRFKYQQYDFQQTSVSRVSIYPLLISVINGTYSWSFLILKGTEEIGTLQNSGTVLAPKLDFRLSIGPFLKNVIFFLPSNLIIFKNSSMLIKSLSHICSEGHIVTVSCGVQFVRVWLNGILTKNTFLLNNKWGKEKLSLSFPVMILI